MTKVKEELEYLAQFLTEGRMQRMDEVLEKRTRYITSAIEDIYQPHNASAVLRSSDCFGLQDVHIIENRNPWNPSPVVSLKADQWLTVNRYKKEDNNTAECISSLKNQGYHIVGTSLTERSIPLVKLSLDKPVALIFGNEKEGISELVEQEADELMKIPMYGFSQSFNISVSAAIIFSHLRTRLETSNINWKLSEEEKELIKLDWFRKSTSAKFELKK